jgi:tetratricopeptide (TPR) repeat protein
VLGAAIAFGDPSLSLSHFDAAIGAYDPVAHGSSRFRLGPNTGVAARVASGITLWLTGDVARGVSRASEALDFARMIDHPFSITYALYHNGYLSLLRGRYDESADFADELGSIATEHDYAIWQTLSTVLDGAARSGLGDVEAGLAKTEAGIGLYQGLTPPPVFWPFLLSLRATVHARAGDIAAAMGLIDEALAIGMAEGQALPWLAMGKADLLLEAPNPDFEEAGALYETTIAVAETLGLKMVQLQASTRLVSCRRKQGTVPDGSEELAAIYSSFHSGHDEPDLLAAASLLS